MSKFSNELKQKLIAYFQEKYGINISEEKAEQYLDVLTDFYLTLISDG